MNYLSNLKKNNVQKNTPSKEEERETALFQFGYKWVQLKKN